MTERTDSIMVNIQEKHPPCVVINGDSRKHTRPSFIGIMEFVFRGIYRRALHNS